MTTRATWCPQCGPGVAVDADDGCCAGCGATATGEGADRAAAAVAELAGRNAVRDAFRDEWMERAQRAEAEAERLKAELEAERAAYRQSQLASEETRWQDGEEADDGLARAELEGRAEKAERRLKEALGVVLTVMWHRGDGGRRLCGACGWWKGSDETHESYCPECCVAGLLARARQEGFSDGE